MVKRLRIPTGALRREASALGVHRPAAPAGAALPPYTPPNAPRERPLPLPLGEVAERSEDGEGKQKKNRLRAVLQLVDKPILSFRGRSAPVGIRDLLTTDLHENA